MLQHLKLLLGFDPSETSPLDDKLRWILDAAAARLKILLGGIDPPEEMEHIITEVAVIRYNRIGSEGMQSHTVEGESQQYGSGEFDAYLPEIQAFLNAQKEAKTGKVRFI